MPDLLTWATFGTDVLVGLTDPADASRGMHVVPGRVERDFRGRAVLRFTLPGGAEPQSVDAARLCSTSAALHLTSDGDGWAVTPFASGSEAHLRWLIREAQRDIRRLLGDRLLEDPRASRMLTALAVTLHSLMLRATMLSGPISHEDRHAA